MRSIKLLLLILILQRCFMIHALYKELAELWNVTEVDVPELLNTESYLRRVDEHFLKQLLDNKEGSFGGSYIDVKKNQIIIRALNETGRNIILSSPQIQPYIELLSFKRARNSLVYLKTMLTQIIDEGRTYKPRGITTYIEVEHNKVVVWTNYNQDGFNRAFLNAIQSYEPIIRYLGKPTGLSRKRTPNLTHNKRMITRQIINSDGIINKDSGGICTSGFWVIDLHGNDYVVTAGHCALKNAESIYYTLSWNSSEPKDEIGPMIHNNVHGTDFGLIQVTNKNIKPTRKIRNTDFEQYRELFIIDDEPISAHNAHLCKSSKTNKKFL